MFVNANHQTGQLILAVTSIEPQDIDDFAVVAIHSNLEAYLIAYRFNQNLGCLLENSKKILIGIGVCLLIMDILLLKIRLVDIPNNYPESADYLNAPLFAMVIWILLPIYSLYVGITAKED